MASSSGHGSLVESDLWNGTLGNILYLGINNLLPGTNQFYTKFMYQVSCVNAKHNIEQQCGFVAPVAVLFFCVANLVSAQLVPTLGAIARRLVQSPYISGPFLFFCGGRLKRWKLFCMTDKIRHRCNGKQQTTKHQSVQKKAPSLRQDRWIRNEAQYTRRNLDAYNEGDKNESRATQNIKYQGVLATHKANIKTQRYYDMVYEKTKRPTRSRLTRPARRVKACPWLVVSRLSKRFYFVVTLNNILFS